MAMTKEQQSEAARGILAKHPLTAEEKARAEFLKREPGNYPRPSETRTCGVCGALFRDKAETKERRAVSALEQFADHQAEHNASPAQWTEAYNKIQERKASPRERM